MVALWISWNIYAASRFDPYPFPLLSAFLALEAVLLTSFVLIRQNAMDLQSERRNHLDLQINLLAEKEATSILKALGEIAEKFDIDLSRDAENSELSKDTPVESIARDLRSQKDDSFGLIDFLLQPHKSKQRNLIWNGRKGDPGLDGNTQNANFPALLS